MPANQMKSTLYRFNERTFKRSIAMIPVVRAFQIVFFANDCAGRIVSLLQRQFNNIQTVG